jgi:hypothetical protein
MDPASPVAAFEQAALDSQVPTTRVAAEATLNAFTARADILQIALSVIFRTRTAIARHHAATALRTAALERWETLSREARYSPTESLRVQLVQFAVSHPIHLFERSSMLRAAAALTCRAYLEENKADRRRFFESVCAAASQPGRTADAQQIITALEMLSMLVAEFSAPPHLNEAPSETVVSFAGFDGELFLIFRAARAALTQIMSASTDRPAEEGRAIARHALVVLSDVLSFGQDDSESKASAVYGVNRGPEWHSVLQDLETLSRQLFLLLDALRPDDATAIDARRALFDVIDGTAAVSRRSYPTQESADASFMVLLQGLEGRSWSASNSRQERLLYAEVWRRFCVAHGWTELVRVAPGALDSFAKNTIQLFRARSLQRSDEDGDDWNIESDCLLLETWAGLVLQAEMRGQTQALEEHVSQVALEFIDNAMTAVLKVAEVDEEEDFGFDDESHEAALFEAAAVLCRVASKVCFARLASLLGDLSQSVFLAAGNNLASAAREGLVWVLRLSSAVLADDGEGELPEVPPQFAREDANVLLCAVFVCAELESRNLQRSSPRLEAVVLSCLTRLSKTYLLPSSPHQEKLATECVGGHDIAMNARALCLRKSIIGVSGRACEPEVAGAAASLLVALAPGRSSGRYPELLDDANWEPLPILGLERFEILPALAVEKVGTALSHYFAEQVGPRIVEPASAALRGLGCSQSQVADAVERALVALHLLGGVTQCSQAAPYVHESIVASIRAPDGGAFCAIRSFAYSNVEVLLAVLKLAQDVVACHLPLLLGDNASRCFADSVVLVEQVTESVANVPGGISFDDLSPLMSASLELLQRLVEAFGNRSTCGRAFYGLSVLAPLMTDQVLTYPSVRSKFYRLVDHLAVSFPDYVPELPLAFGETFLASVQASACRTYEENIARSGLEAVKSLAVFRVQNPTAAGPHLPSMPALDRALDQFAALIWEGLLLGGGRFSSSLDATSEALLPLILGAHRSHAVMERAGRVLTGPSGETDPGTSAALTELITASQRVASALGYVEGGDGLDLAPLAERHRAQAHFAAVVCKFAALTRLTTAGASRL